MRHKGPPIRLIFGLILLLATAQSGCGDRSGGSARRGPTEPPHPGFLVIVHTRDGRHLKFAAASFRPSVVGD